MTDRIRSSQAYEWVKTGHWTKRQFTEWLNEQKIAHSQEVSWLMNELEQQCMFIRELQQQIATSIVVSDDAFDYLGVKNAQEEDQNS